MKKEIKISDFDASEYLRTDEDIAGYLKACLEEGGQDLFIKALGDVAKAKGMSQLAKETGLGRESLYKSLVSGGNPHFKTVLKITQALGLTLDFKTANAAH